MRPLRTTPTFTPPKKRSWKRVLLTLGVLGGLACLMAVIAWYQGRSLPQVQIAGRDAGNQTLQELQHIAKAQFRAIKFNFVSSKKTVMAEPAELGITLDASKTAEQAITARRNPAEVWQLWRPINVGLVLSLDEHRLRNFLQTKFGSDFAEPIDATLQYDANTREFRVVEGELGRGFALREIALSTESLARQPRQLNFEARSHIEPEHTVLTVASSADEANRLLRLRLSFLYQQKVMYVAEPHEIASWLLFQPSSQPGKLSIGFDKSKIANFLQQTVTQSLNSFYGPEGSMLEQESLSAPEKPLQLEAVGDLVNDIVSALTKHANLEKELKVTL